MDEEAGLARVLLYAALREVISECHDREGWCWPDCHAVEAGDLVADLMFREGLEWPDQRSG